MQKTNSLSDFLDKVLKLSNTNLKILAGLTDSFITDDENIIVSITDEKGNPISYQIPSYSFIRKRLDAIDRDSSTLYNLYNKSKYEPSGDLKTIEPPKITNVYSSTNFISESNSILESLMNYSVYTEINLLDKVDTYSRNVLVKKISIPIDTDIDINTFSNVSYDNVIRIINTIGNIQYTEKNDILYFDIPMLKYKGDFIVSAVLENVSDNNYGNVRRYSFNTLTYRDNLTNKDIKNLSIKDILISEDGLRTYVVTNIETLLGDTTQYIVSLALTSGFGFITSGDILKLTSPIISNKTLKVPININEKNVLFFKPIDPYYNTTSTEWSNSIVLTTNELKATIKENNVDVTYSFEDFYKKYIKNFSIYINGIYKDFPIPSYLAEVPNSPTLYSNNFKVVRINSQTSTTISNISEIERILESIRQSEYQEITNYNIIYDTKSTETEKNEARNDLYKTGGIIETKLNNQSKLTNLYNNNIKNKILSDQPKFRIRGFWKIPDSINTIYGTQDVIQFKIRYKYKSKDGEEVKYPAYQYNEYDNNGIQVGNSLNATFSNWIEVLSPIRKKELLSDGTYKWTLENVEDPNIVNINQLDIPINPNESVDIQIIAISEAGWPINPSESNPSNTINIPFPDNLISMDTSNQLILDSLFLTNIKYETNLLLQPMLEELKLLKDEIDVLKSLKIVTDVITLTSDMITTINGGGNIGITLSSEPKESASVSVSFENSTVTLTLHTSFYYISNSNIITFKGTKLLTLNPDPVVGDKLYITFSTYKK